MLAVELYCRTRFGRIHSRNREIIELSERIGRSASSVALKMTNFASLDPTLDRTGMTNASRLDREIWQEFFEDVSGFLSKATALSEFSGDIYADDSLPQWGLREGIDRIATTKQRVNQNYFRRMILSAYDGRCCITGIGLSELLLASHIVPWADDEKVRMDPRNGLCLNALHDKAFDKGLITLDDDYRVMLSDRLKDLPYDFFRRHEGQKINLPTRFRPSADFIRYHRENRFAA